MKIDPKLKHLYARAGFGLSPKEAIQFERSSIPQVIDVLFIDAEKASQEHFSTASGSNSLASDMMSKRKEEKQLVALLNINWLKRMGSQDAAPLLEKMSLFWHGHFACRIKHPKLAHSYLNSIRLNALGNFKDLVLAIAKEPAMLHYLNNKVNKKSSPNENFARELLELFTIGIGNYSEQDVKEAARAFTGWTFSKKTGEFLFRERTHDFGQKAFMGQTGNLDGEDIINIVLKQKATATFIATKVYKYFVNDRVNSKHVSELADVFYETNYNIEILMRTLFNSDWFYDAKNVGNKIKSPIELVAGMTHSLNIEFRNPVALFKLEKILGQVLFDPPNVAGWKGGKSWIDNSTLLLRLNLANYLFKNAELEYSLKDDLEGDNAPRRLRKLDATVHFDDHLALISRLDSSQKMELLSELVIQNTSKLNLKEIEPYLSNQSEDQKHISLILRLMTMPEYQMC